MIIHVMIIYIVFARQCVPVDNGHYTTCQTFCMRSEPVLNSEKKKKEEEEEGL